MRSAVRRLVGLVHVCALLAPGLAHAIWTCHLPDGRSWQQEWPPCVKPADFDQRQPPPQRQRAAPTRQAPEARSTSIEAAPNASNKRLYDIAVAELEALYPELNPDLPVFNQEKSHRVVDIYKEQVRRGLRPDLAIRVAVEDVMKPVIVDRPPVAAPPPQVGLDGSALADVGARGALAGVLLASIFFLWIGAKWLFRAGLDVTVRASRTGGGYVLPAAIGGVLGSFIGVAGFGTAVSGIVPGVLVGALVKKAFFK